MSEYANIEALQQAFKGGDFKFVDTFTVSGAEYRILKSTEYSVLDMLKKNFKALVIYSLRKNEPNIESAEGAGLKEWILFLWGFNSKLEMVPYDVRSTTSARAQGQRIKEGFKEIDQDRIIPDIVKVMLLDLPAANELTGKVDTGADICSLHAEDISIDRANNKVSFNCPELSTNRFTVPLVDQQAIRVPSSEKTEYRPVISLNIKIANKEIRDVKVNLNDRSHMDNPFLVGQNALEGGNFIIDPNIIKDSVEVDDLIAALTEEYRLEVVEDEKTVSKEDAAHLFDIFEQSNLTMSDLVKVLQTEALNRLKDLDY